MPVIGAGHDERERSKAGLAVMLLLAATLLFAAFVFSHLGFARPSKYVAWCGFFVFLLASLGVGRSREFEGHFPVEVRKSGCDRLFA